MGWRTVKEALRTGKKLFWPAALPCIALMIGSIEPSLAAQSRRPATVRPEPQKPPSSWSSTFEAWLAKFTGINPQIYRRLARSRAPASRPTGSRIMVADVSPSSDVLQNERTVGECGDCWSLARLDARRLAVLKEDGLWVFSVEAADAPEHVATIRLGGVREILGRSPEGDLLLVRADPTENYVYSIWAGSLERGDAKSYRDPNVDRILEFDFRALLKPDQVRSGWLLSTSDIDTGDALSIVRFRVGEQRGRELSNGRPLQAARPQSAMDRFDAIWLTDSTIAYISRARSLGPIQ